MYYGKLIKSIIGSKVYDSLLKSIVKLDTKSVVDIDEMASALKIAPRSVVAFLMENLKSMEKGDAKQIPLPWDKNCTMLVNCEGRDCYKGHLASDGKIVHEFELCTIPQLSAHLLSHFELYNEVPEQELQEPLPDSQPSEESLSESSSSSILEHESIKSQIKALESKINALIMLSVQDGSSATIQKSSTKALKSLKKVGIMPKMPAPGRPGVRTGSQEGITQGGIHGDKTAETDLNTHPVAAVKNPHLKTGNTLAAQSGLPQQPKQPKSPKMSFKMSEGSKDSKCLDCGEPDISNGKYVRCACFKTMSQPTMKKSENGVVTLSFEKDWDFDARLALWASLRKNMK